ncbi:hypothetical protein MMF93_21255 [Streptomyces tubbatahanensis]|uniref:Serine/threonine protein kinase n=1 Tax=Streptomyces tubbatahanensis TaxID=2923272 RepID=A0ABY3XW39_9ACTN|nr:hypothetical protein [Streptomyces tubbatahanensis]UNS98704.1 hypothetical protein MMF93_21255 [Streptomyces tubbatahanensis]
MSGAQRRADSGTGQQQPDDGGTDPGGGREERPPAPRDTPAEMSGTSDEAPDTSAEVPGTSAEVREGARRGRRRLLLATALFATLILPKVVSPPGSADSAAARPSPSASSVPAYPTPRPDDSATTAPSPSRLGPTPGSALPAPPRGTPGATGPAAGPGSDSDSLAADFRSIRAGQCLTVHGNGSGWSRPAPTEATRVECGDDRAFTRVTAVHTAGHGGDPETSCPAGNGRAAWTHGRTTLCVTRQFRTDQCLLAESDRGRLRAALMSAPACSSQPPSGGDSGSGEDGNGGNGGRSRYDRLLTITGVYDRPNPCREGDSGTHPRYWSWKVDGGSRTLCAADATE